MLQQNTTLSPQEPRLAPPGAGVPFIQKMLMRFYFKPFVAAKTPWEVSEKNFNRIVQKINAEIEGLTEKQLSTKILVPPQKGLEDSSRYWSMKMVLEHLVIVSNQMMQLIPALSNEVIPPGVADTASVKPFGEISSEESVKQFKKMTTSDFEKLNTSIVNRKAKARFHHPWFGKMNAQEWYWLLAMHHGLHLKQIREIKKRLPLI